MKRAELEGSIIKASEFFSRGDTAMAVLKKGFKDLLIVGDQEGQPAYLFGEYDRVSEYILQKDEMLFNQGNEGKEIFVLLSGSIALYNDSNLKEIDKNSYLATLQKGAILGEMAPFTGEHRSAKAIISSEECVLLKFEINNERGIESDLLLVYKNALHLIAEKLKQSNIKYTS